MLFIRNIKLKNLNQKFSHKFIKSFRIVETMNKQIYRLILFSFYRIHDVFHVFYLKSYKRRKDDNIILKYSSSELLNDNEINKIKKILQKKISKKIIYYLIKWKKLIKEIQWMNNKKKTWMRSICFKNSTNERKENEKLNKNFSLFSKKKHNHYLILLYKQNKKNSLKFWATTTFKRRFDVFIFVENRSFFFFERCLWQSSRISSKIKRRFWIKNRFKNDVSLKRNERRDFFLFWTKEFVERKLIWRIAAWNAILVDVVLWRCHFVVFFIFFRFDNVIFLIIHRLNFFFQMIRHRYRFYFLRNLRRRSFKTRLIFRHHHRHHHHFNRHHCHHHHSDRHHQSRTRHLHYQSRHDEHVSNA